MKLAMSSLLAFFLAVTLVHVVEGQVDCGNPGGSPCDCEPDGDCLNSPVWCSCQDAQDCCSANGFVPTLADGGVVCDDGSYWGMGEYGGQDSAYCNCASDCDGLTEFYENEPLYEYQAYGPSSNLNCLCSAGRECCQEYLSGVVRDAGNIPSEGVRIGYGGVQCPEQSSICECNRRDCLGEPALCGCSLATECCNSASSGDFFPATGIVLETDTYDMGYYDVAYNGVQCPHPDVWSLHDVTEETYCDCEGDCTSDPSLCDCLNGVVCCGGVPPEGLPYSDGNWSGIQCPEQETYCNCDDHCSNFPYLCECALAVAPDCCASASEEDMTEDMTEEKIEDMLAQFCAKGLVGEGVGCLPTCASPDEVLACLTAISQEEGQEFCAFLQGNLLDIQSCFDTYGCCADWVATTSMYRGMGVLPANCIISDACPDLSTGQCGQAALTGTGFGLTAVEDGQEACRLDELVVSFANATGERFCTGLKLDAAACADTTGWDYECQSDDAKESTICPQEFAAVQRLCQERNEAIVVAANVENIMQADTLEYPLTRENYQRMAGFLGLAAAWSKFDHDKMPVLRVELIDAPSDDVQWLCGGEPKGSYMVLSSGPAASVVIPFLYLALSTALTMAGESLIDVGQAIKSRDFLAIGLVGLDGVSEVIGGSLFVSGLKSSVITDGKTIDQCTISGVFDGQEFTFGQGCGGLESMRSLGLQLPGMCTESTTLTVLGLVMGLIDLVIGAVIVVIYSLKRRRDRARRAALGQGDTAAAVACPTCGGRKPAMFLAAPEDKATADNNAGGQPADSKIDMPTATFVTSEAVHQVDTHSAMFVTSEVVHEAASASGGRE